MFSDPYFSLRNGEAETEYVFLQHNSLFSRLLLNDQATPRLCFCIGETGFGTGLNFFVTAQHWKTFYAKTRGNQSKTSHLYYYSIEKYPINKNQLADIVKSWPQFDIFSLPLLAQYPGNCPGFHQIHFPGFNITLLLMIGDVCHMLDQLLMPMDAWYLDGFSPAKNPEMWSQEVFEKIAKASKPDATFATFTAAGFVRRNMQAAGFAVKKAPGFEKKREMLWGNVNQPFVRSKFNQNIKPWYAPDKNEATPAVEPVVIIGAGLAGLSCAFALAQKKIKSVILEAGSQVGAGASGNPAGIVLPKINADLDIESQFYISSFEYAVNQYDALKRQFPELYWHKQGILQFASEKRRGKIAALDLPESLVKVLNASRASLLAGISLSEPAFYYSQAGVINPQQLCEILLVASSEFVAVRYNTKVKSLQQIVEKTDTAWLLENPQGEKICNAKNLVIANAYDASRLLDTPIYTVEANRGQLSYISDKHRLPALKLGVCGEGYIIPGNTDRGNTAYILGATYGGDDIALNQAGHHENLHKANAMLPGFFSEKNAVSGGRVSFRATTADHLPVVGPVIDEAFFQQNYADLHFGRKAENYPNAVYKKGLYVTIGHGSRGLVSCMATSNYLAELLEGSVITAAADVVSLLHPARFLIRHFKKNKSVLGEPKTE